MSKKYNKEPDFDENKVPSEDISWKRWILPWCSVSVVISILLIMAIGWQSGVPGG